MVVEVPVGRAGSLGSKGGTMPPLVASSRMRVPAFSYVNGGMSGHDAHPGRAHRASTRHW
jgi:hypothetical protein